MFSSCKRTFPKAFSVVYILKSKPNFYTPSPQIFYLCPAVLPDVTFDLNTLHIFPIVNRCLRYILRIWWPNIISNKDLWKATGQEDINLEIRKRIFRWIGHTLRKEDREIPKAALQCNPQGSKKRGRPKNSWRRSVIKEAGRSWNELRFLAADRQNWKRLIDNLFS